MTIKEINDMVNARTESVPQTDGYHNPMWYARFFMAEGIIKSGIGIEPCDNPDKTVTETCYRAPYCDEDEKAETISIEVGGRQEPYPSHTIFFVQLRHDYSDQWESHISSVYENRFTDIDYLSVTPNDGKAGDVYEVRIKKWEE